MPVRRHNYAVGAFVFGGLLAVTPLAAADGSPCTTAFRATPDTTTTLVTGGSGTLCSLEIVATATNCATVVYDSPDGTTTGSAKVILDLGVVTLGNSASSGPINRPFVYGLVIDTTRGCYATGSYGN